MLRRESSQLTLHNGRSEAVFEAEVLIAEGGDPLPETENRPLSDGAESRMLVPRGSSALAVQAAISSQILRGRGSYRLRGYGYQSWRLQVRARY